MLQALYTSGRKEITDQLKEHLEYALIHHREPGGPHSDVSLCYIALWMQRCRGLQGG